MEKKKIMSPHIVKRKGHLEQFDERKVYASVYAAALNCHYEENDAEKIAAVVMKKVNHWVKNKGLVNADQIRSQILKEIKDKSVALMYKHHLDLC